MDRSPLACNTIALSQSVRTHQGKPVTWLLDLVEFRRIACSLAGLFRGKPHRRACNDVTSPTQFVQLVRTGRRACRPIPRACANPELGFDCTVMRTKAACSAPAKRTLVGEASSLNGSRVIEIRHRSFVDVRAFWYYRFPVCCARPNASFLYSWVDRPRRRLARPGFFAALHSHTPC